jgi:hypothetical protein
MVAVIRYVLLVAPAHALVGISLTPMPKDAMILTSVLESMDVNMSASIHQEASHVLARVDGPSVMMVHHVRWMINVL